MLLLYSEFAYDWKILI